MSKKDGGYIFLDSIIALLILALTLTSVYSLVVRSIQLEQVVIERLDRTVRLYSEKI